MFENFSRAVTDATTFSDEQVETFFWILFKEEQGRADEALQLLQEHRPDVAKKVAAEILTAATE